MADVAELVELIDRGLAELDEQLGKLNEERARLQAAREALRPPSPHPVVRSIVEATARPQRATVDTPKPKLACPDCDFVAVNGTGLSAHRRKRHPTTVTTTPSAMPDRLQRVADLYREAMADGGKPVEHIAAALRCGHASARGLIESASKRGLIAMPPAGPSDPMERQPFDPEQARLAAAEAV